MPDDERVKNAFFFINEEESNPNVIDARRKAFLAGWNDAKKKGRP